MKTWLKKSTWRKSAALLALPVALLLVIIGGALNANPASAQAETGSVATDLAALVVLYHTTDGANWSNNTNWASGAPMGEWHGVTTNSDGRVTALDLSNNNLSGPLPSHLGDLSLLTELSLHRNEITGQIPAELDNLDNLQKLHLSRNNMTGEIPAFLGGMNSLTRLHLNDNGFTGTVPVELSNLTNLESLLLQSNTGLDGKLPQNLTGMSSLTRIHFQDTGLCYPLETGLARWIARVSDVKGNDCDRAALVALYHATNGDNWSSKTDWLERWPLGHWQGVSTDLNRRVIALDLSENNLVGELPDDLADLTKLTKLALQKNSLSGEIPASLAQLDRLETIYLSRNNLTGEIPAALGGMNRLSRLHLNNNNLTGALPAEFGNLRNLSSLLLYSNSGLSGKLPQSLTGLTNLTRIHFQDTNLCYPLNSDLETWIGGVNDVKGNDCERGALVALYNATDGANWHNNTNWLSDKPLHEWYGVNADKNRNVKNMLLQRNNLRGTIPAELGNLANPKILSLHGNLLTDTIPPELGNLQSLQSLSFSYNYLSGKVPDTLGNLTNLTNLSLGRNSSLSGTLPASLAGLEKMKDIRYDETGLCAPYDYQFLQWLDGMDSYKGEICAPASDKDVLAVFYHATNGDGWTNSANWLSDRPLNEWHGVAINDDGDVTGLNLNGNNLSGALPSQLIDLSELKSLILNDNNLTGKIPAELGSLGALTHLDLSDNGLTGRLPAELNNLSALEDMDISGNGKLCGMAHIEFTGAVLAAINEAGIPTNCQLTERQALTAIYYAMGGPNWTHQADWLSNKHVGDWHGIIHDDDGRVISINFHGNSLTGPIPPEVIYLSKMRWLYAHNTAGADITKLKGEIPAYLGKLTDLEFLFLNGNELTGEVPEEFGNLTKLSDLRLNGNSGLTGSLPQSLTNLENLETFHFQGTGLCAPLNAEFQEWLGGINNAHGDNCPNLDRDALVALYNATDGASWLDNTNWLSDKPLDDWYGVDTDQDQNVSRILLQNNNLHGTIPAELGNLANPKIVRLNGNRLTGPIASELGNLTSLTNLNLWFNLLSGEVPAELGKLTNLTTLDLDKNHLTGTLPQSLTALTEVNYFAYRGRGSSQGPCAPYDYHFLQWLEGLNSYRGEVCEPASDREVLILFYHATNGDNWINKRNWLSDRPINQWRGVETNDDGRVTSVSLIYNRLTGTIPSRLSDLDELINLDLASTSLTGEIPSELGNLTKLQKLRLNENNLTGEIPSELGNIDSLGWLDLWSNDFSGRLPESLTNLENLNTFRFQDTGLCAPLDTDFQTWLGTVALTRGNNCAE